MFNSNIKIKLIFAVFFLIMVFSISANEVGSPASPIMRTSDPAPLNPNSSSRGKSSFGIEPYGGLSIGVSLWEYGPSMFSLRASTSFGLLMNFNSFKLGLIGEGGGFIGVAFPQFEGVGLNYGYYFGSFFELYLKPDFVINLGFGMNRGYFSSSYNLEDNYFFPYTELKLMLGDEEEAYGIYFRYYFNDSGQIYNQFAVGVVIRYFL